jgi:hypothetical protein
MRSSVRFWLFACACFAEVAMGVGCGSDGAETRAGAGGSGTSGGASSSTAVTGTGGQTFDANVGTTATGGGGGERPVDASASDASGAGGSSEGGKPPAGANCSPGGTGFDISVAGVAIDRKTCLVWERNDPMKDAGSCVIARDSPAKLCWIEAGKYCQGLRLDGQSDWRLPTRTELRTLLLADVGLCPRVDTAVFAQALRSIYWTSETSTPDHAWGLDFCDGMDHSAGQDGPQGVRCVRK